MNLYILASGVFSEKGMYLQQTNFSLCLANVLLLMIYLFIIFQGDVGQERSFRLFARSDLTVAS